MAILVPGGPAERQGTLQPGDIILRINGTACATIAQVLGALAAPIDPVRIEALRRQRRVLVAQDLLVRVNLESRAASAPGRNGVGPLPTSWSLCRCELLSDRQLQISRAPVVGGNPADKGQLLGTIDLRSAFNVHLVLVPTGDGPGAGDLSCLQVRTARLVYEFRSEVRGGLARWREPLEQLVMLQLTTRQQGWLHLLQPEAQSQARRTPPTVDYYSHTHHGYACCGYTHHGHAFLDLADHVTCLSPHHQVRCFLDLSSTMLPTYHP